ncbi:uncharacterized protein EI90DRAFT_3129245 [Cantharellus anzutake]|uniref:uncharacterized protein n=1 Tax=Cantharellus anzutake TaxID=1750568 RepID=UPI00190385EE|nr:uncharacterized protein EI90DRAFT_3129245 [Cantharellus anzutake]KAF8324968.1 hypothetical protein EI90DRAFT_3129245 [Cantharellus anzutake]
MVADNGSFIIRLPRHLGANWYESVAILYVSGEPSIHLLSSPGSVPPFLAASHLNSLQEHDTLSLVIQTTPSFGLRFATFVTGATPYRPFIISGDILAWRDSIPHMQNSRVEGDLDSLWLELLSHRLSISLTRRLAYIREYRELLGAPNPKLWLNDTLKLILPIEYHPILFSMNLRDRRNEWYGDRVMGGKDFIYFPRASKDGTRFLIQGRTRAPIVVDSSQII